jgi:hypothetical protein
MNAPSPTSATLPPGAGSPPDPDAGPAPAEGEKGFEFSLNLLTAVVLVALAASIVTLAYRIIAPRFSEPDSGPVRVTVARPKPAPAADPKGPEKGDEVLMDPGHVFRCEEQGRVTFSDRACPSAAPPPAKPAVQ